ncbi:MAG: stage II sporulation protein P [Clostridium sp.]|nr:stage II sporulation protein P [Clostridium sp.]
MKRLRDIFIIFIFVLIIVGAYNTLKFFGFNFNNNTFIDYVSNDFNYIKTPTKDVNRNNIKFYDIINYEYKKIAFNKAKPTIPKEVEVIKNTKDTKDPIVYIYNTHQKEEYTVEKNEPYNITPTVLTTSYMLEEQLLKHGIKSVVEESSVSEALNKNKWKYASSYKVTKTFLEKAKEKYPSLKFYIDVHRDSVKYSITTKTINDKKYARVMFLIGLENKNYEENLKVTEAINSEVEKKYPGLSRGIYKKKGKEVNGVYNQDFSSNCILIEFGGNKNTIDEVYNTVIALGEIISNYIGDTFEK